ncbi:MAG: 2-hydroxyacyl-CoA dehydratase, partial [Planctomycetes bacterium]|nr:2-hydroxyacyl-CoA dehydratase [Planctomycetota bacterium]
EGLGARIVFNELQRQFAMPYATRDLYDQYSRFTYPYDIFFRLADVQAEIQRRRLDGVIHYVQSFCYRVMQDSLVRRTLKLPILTVECDRPGPLDARNKTRIEAFIEMLRVSR